MPLPWTREGSSFGFGSNGSWLPQPSWWGEFSVEAQEADPGSTLHLYREALRLRRSFAADEVLVWDDALNRGPVVAFRRGEVLVVVNTGPDPVRLPRGEVLLASGELDGMVLPGDTAAWLRVT